MRILFVSGSSGGHLAPLVAVWRVIKEKNKKADCFFLCSTKKADAEFLTQEGVPFTTVPAPKKNLALPFSYVRNKRTAKKIIHSFKPDVVFSKGGSVSIPACRVAAKKKIPVVLHESDSVMGKANRHVAKFASAICLGFPPSDEQLGFRVNPVVTGNPVRPSVIGGNRKRGLEMTHLTGKKPILLIFGGSQGEASLNEAVVRNLNALLSFCDVIHIT